MAALPDRVGVPGCSAIVLAGTLRSLDSPEWKTAVRGEGVGSWSRIVKVVSRMLLAEHGRTPNCSEPRSVVATQERPK